MRKGGYINLTDQHRNKIRNSKVLNRLISHAEGTEPNMKPSEVHAAISLLGFAYPKLQQVDLTAEHTVTVKAIRYLTEQEWLTKKATQTLTIAHDDNSDLSTPATNGSQFVSVTEEPERP